ncbi:MAG: alkaline phosphatase D family protein [Nannocystaceae bacterium]|nr:alkaline phosphatase D family protein [Nannocystaceae bacterium]
MAVRQGRGGPSRREFLELAGGAAASGLLGCGGASDPAAGGEGGESSSTGEPAGSSSSDGGSSGALDGTGGGGSSSSGGADDTTTGEVPTCEPGTAVVFAADAIPEDATMFPLAIIAGEMTPRSFMVAIWIPDGAPRRLRVWRALERDDMVALAFDEDVAPDDAGFVKVTVEGLCPGTWYHYGVFDGPADGFTARSRVAQVRTAIAEDATEPLVLALAACNGDVGGTWTWSALDVMSDEPYDMIVHLGDQIYADGAFTRDEYRAAWRSWLGTEGYKRFYAGAGLYATWDDHEVDDNGNFDRETMEPEQVEKRDNALAAFFEVMPIADDGSRRLWRSHRWGLTAEIIVLDCRYERRPSQGTYISADQMAFLQDRLRNSPCHFKIVVNSVPITNMPLLWDVAAADRWEGYKASRDALLQFIDQHDLRNVWFLSGDFHVCFVSRLEPSGDGRAAGLREIALTSGNTSVLGDLLLGPQFAFGSSAAHGVLVTLDPAADTVNVRFIDADGNDAFAQSLSDAP